jgi:hypothetical protein
MNKQDLGAIQRVSDVYKKLRVSKLYDIQNIRKYIPII